MHFKVFLSIATAVVLIAPVQQAFGQTPPASAPKLVAMKSATSKDEKAASDSPAKQAKIWTAH